MVPTKGGVGISSGSPPNLEKGCFTSETEGLPSLGTQYDVSAWYLPHQ